MSEISATTGPGPSSGVDHQWWAGTLRPKLQGLLELITDLDKAQKLMSTERVPTRVTEINRDILLKSTVRDDEIIKIHKIISDTDTGLGNETSAAMGLLSSLDVTHPQIVRTLCRFTALPTPETIDTWLNAVEPRTRQLIATLSKGKDVNLWCDKQYRRLSVQARRTKESD